MLLPSSVSRPHQEVVSFQPSILVASCTTSPGPCWWMGRWYQAEPRSMYFKQPRHAPLPTSFTMLILNSWRTVLSKSLLATCCCFCAQGMPEKLRKMS